MTITTIPLSCNSIIIIVVALSLGVSSRLGSILTHLSTAISLHKIISLEGMNSLLRLFPVILLTADKMQRPLISLQIKNSNLS
jgi:hypothetical protein